MVNLLPENDNLRKITGVDRFHAAGYYGERCVGATGENWQLSIYDNNGRCFLAPGVEEVDESQIKTDEAKQDKTHARRTAATAFEVAPLHRLMINPLEDFSSTSKMDKGLATYFENIKNHNVRAMFTSMSIQSASTARKKYSTYMQSFPNFVSCFSAGNHSTNSYNSMMRIDEIFGIGGFDVNGTTLKINRNSSWTNDSKYVAFCGPFRVRTCVNGVSTWETGTSFATPWVYGMCILIDDFFIHKTGKPLTRATMKQFLIDYRIDIEDPGEDNKSGWGVPCLPYPRDIDIDKYRGDKMLTFTDKAKISPWASESVEYCVNKGIIKGDDNNTFRPKDSITREEFCVALKRALESK